jgi:polyhydroxybutyrate depolymerase
MKFITTIAYTLSVIIVVMACTKKMDIATDLNPGSEVLKKGVIKGSLQHNGQTRNYILYIPEIYTGDEAVPLVFNFHGYTSNASDQMGYGDFRSIADTANFILIHPEGTLLDGKTHWNVGGWTLGSSVDDVSFAEAMIDFAKAEYKIDQSKIYSTGMSNGGYMSFLLACQLGEKIAAVASVTGSMTPQMLSACEPNHPTPILQIHGTNDDVVPYHGNQVWTHSIAEVMNYWVKHNNCKTLATTTALENSDASDGSTVEHIIYEGGDKKTVAIHYKVTGGGHTWPGTVFKNGKTNNDFNAAEVIWQFFSKYDLDGLVK